MAFLRGYLSEMIQNWHDNNHNDLGIFILVLLTVITFQGHHGVGHTHTHTHPHTHTHTHTHVHTSCRILIGSRLELQSLRTVAIQFTMNG